MITLARILALSQMLCSILYSNQYIQHTTSGADATIRHTARNRILETFTRIPTLTLLHPLQQPQPSMRILTQCLTL